MERKSVSTVSRSPVEGEDTRRTLPTRGLKSFAGKRIENGTNLCDVVIGCDYTPRSISRSGHLVGKKNRAKPTDLFYHRPEFLLERSRSTTDRFSRGAAGPQGCRADREPPGSGTAVQ